MFERINNPAGFWIRIVASILDGLIVGIPISVISYMFTGTLDSENIFTNLLGTIYGIVLPIIWSGYTVGKRIVGIRIARVDGEKVGIGTMLLRFIVAPAAYIITLGIAFIISGLMVMIRKDKRSLHDFIAGTYVTYDKPLNKNE